ncbi:MAG: fibronectin type III domain-containing protein, partial [Ferruginibacter sp.]
MKKISLLILLCFISVASLYAQFFTTTTCSPSNSATYGPLYSTSTANATGRFAYIYPSTQLTGISGTTLTDIYFNRSTASGSITAGGNLKIYLAEVSQIDWGTTALDWATAIAGATLVYDGDPSTIVGSTAGWKKFPLTPNFTYAGTGNLAVLTEYTNPLASTSITWFYEFNSPCVNTLTTNATKYSTNTTGTLPASLTLSTFRRPDIGFDVLLTCYPPTGVSITNTTTTTADLSFTAPVAAPSGGYQYYVTTSATPPTSGTTPTGTIAAGSTSANLTGLTGGQAYYVYVRSDCGAGDISPWTGVTIFYVTPSNDDCGGAIDIGQAAACVNTAGSTAGSTPSSNPLAPCTGIADDDVWFSFTATQTDAQIA